ncbi:hypothetical protein RIF29_24800 [Crotalaria pallida]|uniref:Uncharacterized protein n=1 Tax=Crotalaria pallida TaxID=3830 RepID=A0AAN9EQJ2_CROPI
MIDTAPFNMYTKADYKIVKTDSILVLPAVAEMQALNVQETSSLKNLMATPADEGQFLSLLLKLINVKNTIEIEELRNGTRVSQPSSSNSNVRFELS